MNKVIFLIIVMVGFTQSLFSGLLDEYSKSCSEGDSKGCYQLGIAYRDGLEVEQNTIAYKRFFKLACELGNTQACSDISFVKKNEDQVKINSIEGYKKSCFAEDFQKCFMLGLAYYEGKKIERNYKTSKKYLMLACDNQVGVGCSTLAILYEKGNGVRQDYAKAKEYYKRGCDYGHSNGCLMLGMYYEKGLGGKQDLYKAREYYSISKVYHESECVAGDGNGCLMLGYVYDKGNGVEQDKKKAKRYYQKACNFGDAIGCKQIMK